MSQKVIICGCRDFTDRDFAFRELDRCLAGRRGMELVSGHASGADYLGELYAKARGIPCRVFPAKWNAYGRAAGPIRNREMLLYIRDSDRPSVIAFWDGRSRGTGNMIRIARDAGISVTVIDIRKTGEKTGDK